MNATARRAREPNPDLDVYGPRLLCGERVNGALCKETVAWVAEGRAQPGLVVIPDGLVKDGPGVYRWSQRATPRSGAKRVRPVNRAGHAPGYDTDSWNQVGPIRFARTPCTIPCPQMHKNDVDISEPPF